MALHAGDIGQLSEPSILNLTDLAPSTSDSLVVHLSEIEGPTVYHLANNNIQCEMMPCPLTPSLPLLRYINHSEDRLQGLFANLGHSERRPRPYILDYEDMDLLARKPTVLYNNMAVQNLLLLGVGAQF